MNAVLALVAFGLVVVAGVWVLACILAVFGIPLAGILFGLIGSL